MTTTFTLTLDHIALLRGSYVSWNDETEYGAAAIDDKRPYGNSGDLVERDIAVLLGWIPRDTPSDAVPTEMRQRAAALHLETETALQIVLRTGEFTPGRYELVGYGRNWRRVA